MKNVPPVVVDPETQRSDDRDRERMEHARTNPPYPDVGPGRVRPFLFVDADRCRAASSPAPADPFPGERPLHVALLLPVSPVAGGPDEPSSLAPHPAQGRQLPGVQPAHQLAAW